MAYDVNHEYCGLLLKALCGALTMQKKKFLFLRIYLCRRNGKACLIRRANCSARNFIRSSAAKLVP